MLSVLLLDFLLKLGGVSDIHKACEEASPSFGEEASAQVLVLLDFHGSDGLYSYAPAVE